MAENIKNLGKVCITPEGFWDINKSYDRLALVLNPEDQQSYISRKPIIPSDRIQIGNKDYWQLFTNKVEWADMYVGDDGWLYIGDTPIYQITLNDVLGDVVVEKIEQKLTEKIMQAINAYMSGVVSNFVNAITSQIDRLIAQGIKISNNHSGSINVDAAITGEIENNNTNIHSGELGVTHKGQVAVAHSGRVNTDVALSGGIDVNGGVTPPAPITKYRLTVNPTPSDATVTLNGEPIRSGEFDENSTVEVIISKAGYITKTQTINITEDTVLNITLEQIVDNYTFTPDHTKTELNYNESPAILGVISKKNGQDAEWTYEVKSGQSYIDGNITKGGSTLTVPVKANENTTSRSVVIKFIQNGSNNSFETIITQNGKPNDEYYIHETEPRSEYSGPDTGQLIFENDSYTTDYYVESYKTVNDIKQPVPFRVEYAPFQSEVDWCIIGEPVLVEGCKYKFTVSVKTHSAPINVERSVRYYMIQTEGSNKYCDLTVTQGILYKLELNKFMPSKNYPDNTNFYFDAEGNEKTGDDLERIFVSSLRCHVPVDYEIENNLNWVNFIFDYPNEYECRIVVSPNAGEARNGTVTIKQNDVNGEGGFKTLTYNFYQDAGEGPTPTETFTIEVNPITEGATVTMNGVAGNSQTFDKGSNVTVVISKVGYLTKTENINNLTANTTINGELTPVPTPTYEFVGILSGPGGDYEQDLTTAIRLTTADNSVTLTPRVKINGQLRTDVDVNIILDRFSPEAQNTDKFKVESDGMILTISTLGEEPSEPISTSYDITVRYDGHTESFTFEINWDV